MSKEINEYTDAGHDKFFDITLASCASFNCVLPFETVEDFNNKEAGGSVVEQKSDESFFGENIREAKAVLRDIFKR